MAKKLSDVLKGTNSSKTRPGSTGSRPGVDYAGKMEDERNFVAAHTTQEFEDRVGNGSDVFNASNIKHQPDDKHGHIPKPKDEKQYKLNNEENETEDQKHEEKEMMKRQLHFIKYAADEIMGHVDKTDDPEEWFQNKLASTHEQIRGLHSYIEGDKRLKDEKEGMKEEAEVEEGGEGDPRVQPKDVKKSARGKKLSLITDKKATVKESNDGSRTKTDTEAARDRFHKKMEKKEEREYQERNKE